VEKVTGTNKGRKRQLKSCVGRLDISKQQASRLGVAPYNRLSPVLETCSLLLSGNESYQNAEADIYNSNWGEGWTQYTAPTRTDKRVVFSTGQTGNFRSE
jgi:hypothetical protein